VVSVDRRPQQFVDQLRAAGYAVDDAEDDPLCGREAVSKPGRGLGGGNAAQSRLCPRHAARDRERRGSGDPPFHGSEAPCAPGPALMPHKDRRLVGAPTF
jgi:hypothetical protein